MPAPADPVPEPPGETGRVPPPPVGLEPGRVARCPVGPLHADPWLVLRLARYRRRDEVVPPIWDATRAMSARAEALARPEALARLVSVVEAGPAGVRLAEGSRFSGAAVGRLLAGCPWALAVVLTLGPALEAEAAERAERHEVLEAFLLDTAGWALIETAARTFRRAWAARLAPAGWRITHRLGPGHQDWPLGEQQTLLALFAAAPGPVSLSAHGVLVPFKTISGLFGLRPR